MSTTPVKTSLFNKVLPHLIAVVIFLVVALIYCKPALEGKVLQQSDVTQWKGSFEQSEKYKEIHGTYPLWTNSLFGGMPTIQIGGVAGNYIAGYFHRILTLGLPDPIGYFFLSCLAFYFLCIVLRINPYVGILGALAFAYATYNPVIIAVGHNTKMLSISYMPAVLGSVLLIFKRRYLLGTALTALFASSIIAMNHLQITYYLFLTIGVMTVFYLVNWIKIKDWKHIGLVISLSLGAALIGVMCNSVSLFSTYEYQKATIRGGSSELAEKGKNTDAEKGLGKDYAFSYSMFITEPFVMLIPHMYGGSSDKLELAEDKSKAIEALQTMPQELAQQLQPSLNFYWGGLKETGIGTSGPPYVGAVIFFLAIIALIVIDKQYRWWMLTAIVLAIFISWGSYFQSFNNIFYNYLPFYNKFRAPSMILVIPQLLFPILAVLGLDAILNTGDKKTLLPVLKKALAITGGIFAFLFVLYFSFDFLAKGDTEMLKQAREMNQPQILDNIKNFVDGLVADRKSLMMGDILRSLGFIAVAAGLVYLLIRNTFSPKIITAGFIIFALIDVLIIDSKYLNGENYQDKEENAFAFQKTPFDEAILADTSYYRVFNTSGNAFNENFTSYHYHSVGGYHPAKLLIYQDFIEKKLSTQQLNMFVYNMLNTKYFIQKDGSGQTTNSQTNPGALGPAWFVSALSFVKSPQEEMALLGSYNPRDTAIIQEKFKASIPFLPQPDSTATIKLIKNDNDKVLYESSSSTNQFATFSEVYYEDGWKAFVDGKEMPIVRTNYILRGLALPAGKHSIEFKFEPKGYYTGKTLTTIASIVLLLLLAGAAFFELKTQRRAGSN